MGEPTVEAYKAALAAAFPGLPACLPLAEAERRTRAAVDAVWPIAEAAVRAQVAAEIRAELEQLGPSGLTGPGCRDCRLSRGVLEKAARIAEGNPGD